MKCKLAVLLFIYLFSSALSASLLITPSRVAFAPNERSKEVILLNTSAEPKSYMVEWVNQAQNKDGAYRPLTAQEEDTFPKAEEYLRISPRRVTLQPGENQKVKLILRRKTDMEALEYRSHLKFTALPNEISNPEETEETTEGISIKLNLLLSYTIPVIVRTDEPNDNVKIVNVKLEQGQNSKGLVNFALRKNHASSIFGNFTVYHQDAMGKVSEVGYLNGVNMFSEVNEMYTSINLLKPYSELAGKLQIRFNGKSEFTDTILDQVTYEVN